MTKTALVTGVTGMDGAYLARYLVSLGYRVIGLVRPAANPWRLERLTISHRLQLVEADVTNELRIRDLLADAVPDEVYNLAGQSSVALSFREPVRTADVNAMSVVHLCESIRQKCPNARLVQASSASMYGEPATQPQSELTPFRPDNPYGTSKLMAHHWVGNARHAYGLHASCAILFNHESPLRDLQAVTRKIARAFAEMRHGRNEPMLLGNLDGARDWGYVQDYVVAMHQMANASLSDDYVVATGRAFRVRDFVEAAARSLGFDLEWQGTGPHERGVDRVTGKELCLVDTQFYRKAEGSTFLGDPTKARERLGWEARTSFEQLVEIMVRAELSVLTGAPIVY